MKGQGTFLKPAEIISYNTCIYCEKKERTNGLFCEKCFKKDFLKRLAKFQKLQLTRGFKNPDLFIMKHTHGGRLMKR